MSVIEKLGIKKEDQWPRDYDLDFVDPHGDVDDSRESDERES